MLTTSSKLGTFQLEVLRFKLELLIKVKLFMADPENQNSLADLKNVLAQQKTAVAFVSTVSSKKDNSLGLKLVVCCSVFHVANLFWYLLSTMYCK
jgi:hypothetical protein